MFGVPGRWLKNLFINHLGLQFVPITATGLQGSKPLVFRIIWIREVGKIDSKLRNKDWL